MVVIVIQTEVWDDKVDWARALMKSRGDFSQ